MLHRRWMFTYNRNVQTVSLDQLCLQFPYINYFVLIYVIEKGYLHFSVFLFFLNLDFLIHIFIYFDFIYLFDLSIYIYIIYL